MSFLIDQGTDVRGLSRDNHSAIHLTLHDQRLPNLDSEAMDSLLTQKSWEDALKATLERIIAGGVDLRHTDTNGFTALQLAVKRRFTGIAEMLVKRGSTVDQRDWTGRSVLHLALSCPKQAPDDMVKFLLRNNAQVDLMDNTVTHHCDLLRSTIIKRLSEPW